jgi:hypothetical protein
MNKVDFSEMPLLPCIFLSLLSLSLLPCIFLSLLSLSLSLSLYGRTHIHTFGTEPVLEYDFSILIENYLEHRDFCRTPLNAV